MHARLHVARGRVAEHAGAHEHADAAEDAPTRASPSTGAFRYWLLPLMACIIRNGTPKSTRGVDPRRRLAQPVPDLEAEHLAERHGAAAVDAHRAVRAARAPWWPAMTLK